VTRNVDDSKQTDDLIVDFSKTFDKVNHNLLIHQVKHYGIRGKVNNWIESYLSGRSQADIESHVERGIVCHIYVANYNMF
jgi:hypothetical protein